MATRNKTADNADATDAGVTATSAPVVAAPGEPATSAGEPIEKASGSDVEAVKAYLANPLGADTSLPEGISINFGDPEPIRKATPSELRTSADTE